MFAYQWSFGTNWVDCTTENSQKLSARRANPSPEPLCISNPYGELWGVVEDGKMKFRLHGEDEISETQIRRAPEDGELPMYAIVEMSGLTLLSYEACRALFSNELPKSKRVTFKYGNDTFMARDEDLFQYMDGDFVACRWKRVDISRLQFEDMTRTRFSWHFKGPMRCDRMRLTIRSMLHDVSLSSDHNRLDELYERFSPRGGDTEYGSFQFPDYLTSIGESGLAFKVADAFSKIPTEDWTPFDPITNIRIEEAREQHRPVVLFRTGGEKYMIVFDAGNGEAGQSAVVIRPSRYQKIMESIEEQYHESVTHRHEKHMHELYDTLVSNNLHPRIFIMSLAVQRERALASIEDVSVRENVLRLISEIESARGEQLTTRMQQFMPTLLHKFKECEIKMSSVERTDPKRLCTKVVSTIEHGLSVPESQNDTTLDFKKLVRFIQTTQSWLLPKGTQTCDICSATHQTTLTHCGSANACLKCWSESLVQSNMACPFCRGTVGTGQLKGSGSHVPSSGSQPAMKRSRKRKRSAYDTAEDILHEIHKDEKYTNISLTSKESMRKWFTILVRRKMVGIAQMPRNEQGKKEFVEAMKTFKLLN